MVVQLLNKHSKAFSYKYDFVAAALLLLFGGLPKSACAQLVNGNELASQFYDGKTAIIYAHPDDELLWMEPFWASSAKIYQAVSPASSTHLSRIVPKHTDWNYVAKWNPLKGATSDYEYGQFLQQTCGRMWTYNLNNFKELIRPVVASANTRRIITHNNWGEYGHIHHKWLNRAVRELAVKYKKDVWMLATKVGSAGGSYVDLGNMGLPYVNGDFDTNIISKYRSLYQATYLTVPIYNAAYDLWSWYDGYWDFPSGRRTFVKIVAAGKDYSKRNSGVVSATNQYSSAPNGVCQEPLGYLDKITSAGRAKGWAFDGSNFSQSIYLHFYIDGTASANYAGYTLASKSRSDVSAYFGIPGRHGFSWQIPTKYRDGRTHTLYAFGIDSSNAGPNPPVGNSPKTFIWK